jgi:hypothetical protein
VADHTTSFSYIVIGGGRGEGVLVVPPRCMTLRNRPELWRNLMTSNIFLHDEQVNISYLGIGDDGIGCKCDIIDM